MPTTPTTSSRYSGVAIALHWLAGLGIVGAFVVGAYMSDLPMSLQRLKRDDIAYRPIADSGIVTPMLMTTRVDDQSQDLVRLCAAVVAACGQGA